MELFLFNYGAVVRRAPVVLILILLSGLAPQTSSAQGSILQSTSPRIVVGYFPQWGLYQDEPYTVKSLVESGAALVLDQINYAQGFVTGGRCSVADPHADLDYAFTAENSVDGSADSPKAALRGNFHQLLELKRRDPHLKILISLEGRASDFAADAQPEARANFVASCVDLFLKGNLPNGASAPGLFDGIDLDWEYPRGADSANYLPLLAEFRRQMDAFRPGLRLTVALGASPQMYGEADLAAVGDVVDLAGLMTYDFNGPWSSTTGFIAPLVSASPDDDSVETSVGAWMKAGIPANKLLIGLPFYAYGWRGVASGNNGLRQDGNPIRGDHPYRFIQTLIRSNVDHPSQVADVSIGTPLRLGMSSVPQTPVSESAPPATPMLYRDPVSQAPWLFDGSAFWTYEDPTSISSKADFALRDHLGGFMVWELSGDTASASLLKAAHDSLARPAQKARASAPRTLEESPTP